MRMRTGTGMGTGMNTNSAEVRAGIRRLNRHRLLTRNLGLGQFRERTTMNLLLAEEEDRCLE